MLNNDDADAEVVFEYTGKGCAVPKRVTIVRFHPSVTEVEDDAFNDRNNLTGVLFNDGLKKIGHDAFYGCESLSSITLPSTITEIGNSAFCYCMDLCEVVLNDGMQKIGQYAFYSCTSLLRIKLPSTVTEIGKSAFMYCERLEEVAFHEGLHKIENHAFYNCEILRSITLPSTVTEIGDVAFYGCRYLREIVLHGVPREMGKNAFQYCTSLERFTFPTISAHLDNLIQTGHWEEIENEVDEVRGVVERRGGKLFVSTEIMGGGENWNWNQARESLNKIIRLISCYEIKEGTSIFELALWKFKLDQVDKDNPIPRKKCRMDVPGPVKDIILQYLSYECIFLLPDV